jgi:hypothetical protein
MGVVWGSGWSFGGLGEETWDGVRGFVVWHFANTTVDGG